MWSARERHLQFVKYQTQAGQIWSKLFSSQRDSTLWTELCYSCPFVSYGHKTWLLLGVFFCTTQAGHCKHLCEPAVLLVSISAPIVSGFAKIVTWNIQPYVTINARKQLVHMFTTIYSHILVYTTKWTGTMKSETNVPKLLAPQHRIWIQVFEVKIPKLYY